MAFEETFLNIGPGKEAAKASAAFPLRGFLLRRFKMVYFFAAHYLVNIRKNFYALPDLRHPRI